MIWLVCLISFVTGFLGVLVGAAIVSRAFKTALHLKGGKSNEKKKC